MRRFFRIAGVSLFTLLSLFFIAFGILYASVRDLLWFHAAAVPSAALDDVRPIYFALMKLIGGAAGGLGLIGAYVALFPVRGGNRLAAFSLSLAYAVPIIMAAIVAEALAATTGAPTSWHIMGVLLGATALALVAVIASGKATNAGAGARGDRQ